MNHKHNLLIIFILFVTFILANCNLPRVSLAQATATAVQPATPQASHRRIPCRLLSPPSELGLAENPLILALPPSANSQEQIDAAKVIASQFTERTGYTVVTVIPDSYSDLVDSLAKGNAHIVLLDPYAYELAFQRNLVRASYAVLKDGERKYGAQFLARRTGWFHLLFR